MSIQNPSFEAPSATPGIPSNWALSTVVTSEEIAAFDTVPEPFEDFEEGWLNDSFIIHFDDDDLAAADFDILVLGDTPEGFERGWGNDGFLFHLGSAGTALFAGNVPYEHFAGRTVHDGSTNIAGTLLTSVEAAFTASDIGRYVSLSGQPVSQITAVAGDDATISPAWTGLQVGLDLDIIEWNQVVPLP